MSTLEHYIVSQISSGNTAITLPAGVFREKLHIEAEHLEVTGSNTTIEWNDCAKKQFDEHELYGTFRSYTAFFRSEFLLLQDVTIINFSGIGERAGQAVAAYFDCRRAHIRNCSFKGFQDTIFTSPLPEKPVIPNSFKGPNDNLERKPSLLYFENCYIEGDVDFIFGGACAIFDNCEIHSLRKGYTCAPSTPASQQYGYIFINCRFTGDCENESTYIARPWRKDGACTLIDCTLGRHISPLLWHDWDCSEKRECCRFYSEYPHQATFGHLLTSPERSEVLEFTRAAKVAMEIEYKR